MTNMVKNSTQVQASIAAPLADEYVKANLRTLGLESFTASYWFHKIQVGINKISGLINQSKTSGSHCSDCSANNHGVLLSYSYQVWFNETLQKTEFVV